VLEDCHDADDFLRIVRESIAGKQGVERWAKSTPLHLLYLPLIKKVIPDILVVHAMAATVTTSLNRLGYVRPLP
jgi:hypothetical protein